MTNRADEPAMPGKNAPDAGERGVVGLADIGEAIRTEDNACTSHPVFVVEQQRTVWGIDTDYDNDGFEWLDADGPVEPRKRDRLERLHQAGGDTGDYRRLGYKHYWEFVTACFTRKGCEDYLRQNGHNLKSPRIYVHSAWRNDEWQRLRAALRAQPAGGGDIPQWALPAVESALSIMDLQGYWHSDLAAFRDWLKEKSA